jgi:hypothetical protein
MCGAVVLQFYYGDSGIYSLDIDVVDIPIFTHMEETCPTRKVAANYPMDP